MGRSLEDAHLQHLYRSLSSLAIGGQSALWASRHTHDSDRRPLVLHGMFGAKKLALVRSACGQIRKATFTYDGCGECTLREVHDVLLRSPEPRAAAATRSPVEGQRGIWPSKAHLRDLHHALLISAATTSLHQHMRNDSEMLQSDTASTGIARAIALLQSWLSSGKGTELNADTAGIRFSVDWRHDSTAACACQRIDGRHVFDVGPGFGPHAPRSGCVRPRS